MSSRNDYSGLGIYGAQYPQVPMLNTTSGSFQMPLTTAGYQGMDWGGMPTGEARNAMVTSLGNAGQGDWMSSLKNIGQSVKDFLPNGFLGSTDANGIKTDGWGSTALGVANGLMSGYMGMKQYGLSKDIFENNKAQFERQYSANKTLTNGRLEDRQKARIASNPGAYDSLDSYMKKNGVA